MRINKNHENQKNQNESYENNENNIITKNINEN